MHWNCKKSSVLRQQRALSTRLMNWSSPAVGAKPKLGLMRSPGVPLKLFPLIKWVMNSWVQERKWIWSLLNLHKFNSIVFREKKSYFKTSIVKFQLCFLSSCKLLRFSVYFLKVLKTFYQIDSVNFFAIFTLHFDNFLLVFNSFLTIFCQFSPYVPFILH